MASTERVTDPNFDVVVIGGGPSGAIAGLRAARAGLAVVILEQDRHPRFHVGESLLPLNLQLLRDLDLEEDLRAVPRVRKLGGSFVLGHETETSDFHFETGLIEASPETFNVERAPFDAFLIEAARNAGVELRQQVTVRSIDRLEDGAVAVTARDSDGVSAPVRGKYLIDASGQGSVVGRHLGTRRSLPDLKKVAYFGHYEGAHRRDGDRGGFPVTILCREGWFWLIPINDRLTSVGLVMDAGMAARIGVSPTKMLAWGLSRSPTAAVWTEHATGPADNEVTADFSYTCRPYAGPGHFLAGDAATFVDPIFSTGVCLGMKTAIEAADGIVSIVRDGASPSRVRRDYVRLIEGGTGVFFRIVRASYRHEFRELFLHGEGPFKVRRALVSVLSGHVFPRPAGSLRWRLALFHAMVALQRFVPLVPRRQQFSLIEGRTTADRRSVRVSPAAASR